MRLAEPIGWGDLPVPHSSVVSQIDRPIAASSSEASTYWPLPVFSRPMIGLVLEIERDAALVTVEREKARAVLALQAEAHRMPRRIAEPGRLDLDHIGAHVAEEHTRERAGHDLGDIEHPDSRER